MLPDRIDAYRRLLPRTLWTSHLLGKCQVPLVYCNWRVFLDLSAFTKVLRDSITISRGRLIGQVRARTWPITASATGFAMVAPLLFLGETIVGKHGERLEPFFSLSGYTGYLAVPPVLALLTNSAYSWIGRAVREEQHFTDTARRISVILWPVGKE